MSFFYEIRSSDNTVLKRDGGFATREAAATAGREDVREMKAIPKPSRPDVGRLLVGQNMDKPTRHLPASSLRRDSTVCPSASTVADFEKQVIFESS